MVCGQAQLFEVSRYKLCWTWHGPWVCRKTEIKTKYVYDFSVLRRRYRGFTVNYKGCCDSAEFSWSGYSWRIFWNPSDSYFVRKTFDKPLIPTGRCTLIGSPRVE